MSKRFLFLLLISLLLSACSQKVAPRNSAEKFFQEGEKFYESELYEDAIASWEKVRDSYYSPELNMLAELKIAETYYRSERYEEAAAAYNDFLKQHPNDNRIADVIYRLGLSHYQQILGADRDQTSARNALAVFQELRRRFPEHPQAEEAGYLIQRCSQRLAEHELYVGHYYLKKKHYQAAITRLNGLLENYPDFQGRDAAYYYLVQAQLQSGGTEQAKATFKHLLEEFPGSKYILEAQKALSE